MFHKWISLMAERLAPLIRWPNQDELRKTLPMTFRNFFSKCTCIIDCTEIFIDWPSDLKACYQTWSNYKQHNTVKKGFYNPGQCRIYCAEVRIPPFTKGKKQLSRCEI